MLFTKKHLIEKLKSDLKDKLLKATEETTLYHILEEILNEVNKDMEDVDYKFALTKESVPIMLLAIANYSNQYYSTSPMRRALFRIIFNCIAGISKNNNSCKA